MAKQKKKMWEQWPWCWTWRRPLSGSVSFWFVLGRRISASQGRSCDCCAGTSSSSEGVCSSELAHDHRGFPAGVQVELFAFLRIVVQDALSEVTKFYPLLRLRVFVDDITALLMGRNKEFAEMSKKVMKQLKKEVNGKGLKIVSDRRWEGRE